MAEPRQPVFLARSGYRDRRLSDLARLIPIVGAVFFMLPLLWTGPDTEGGSTGAAGLWIFSAWFLLIVVTALVARRLRQLNLSSEPGLEGPAQNGRIDSGSL